MKRGFSHPFCKIAGNMTSVTQLVFDKPFDYLRKRHKKIMQIDLTRTSFVSESKKRGILLERSFLNEAN